MPRRTALIVPVPAAGPFYDPGNGLPAHVTVLFPFLEPEAIDELAVEELVGRFPAFDFTLDRLEHFDGGTAWLRPLPSAPFVDLTMAVWQRWPSHAPYEGAFDAVIPHLSVTVEDVPLPIAARAAEVVLVEERESDGTWSRRRSFALADQGVAYPRMPSSRTP